MRAPTTDYAKFEQKVLASGFSIYLVLILSTITAILTTAMGFQYINGEIPCPLCLLQRVALFGVCFGIMLQFKCGFSNRHTGMSIVFTIFLLIVSARQTLINIYPRPGHEYVGSAILGIHMPVWSVLIAVALLIAFALQLIIWGDRPALKQNATPHKSSIRLIVTIISIYIILISLINLVSVSIQCGINVCHTFGYVLLQ